MGSNARLLQKRDKETKSDRVFNTIIKWLNDFLVLTFPNANVDLFKEALNFIGEISVHIYYDDEDKAFWLVVRSFVRLFDELEEFRAQSQSSNAWHSHCAAAMKLVGWNERTETLFIQQISRNRERAESKLMLQVPRTTKTQPIKQAEIWLYALHKSNDRWKWSAASANTNNLMCASCVHRANIHTQQQQQQNQNNIELLWSRIFSICLSDTFIKCNAEMARCQHAS